MALLAKDIARVDVSRLDRAFCGIHTDENPRSEFWIEAGHWLEGFELIAKRIKELDGKLRFRNRRKLGRKVEGRAEPLQNKIEDYRLADRILNGPNNWAFLCGDQLWYFGLTYLGANEWRDNRISLSTDIGYSSPMQKSFTEFSGYVRDVQIFRVSNLQLASGKLTFKKLATYNLEDLVADKDVKIIGS